jgi:AdoMet-dependent heme synthase
MSRTLYLSRLRRLLSQEGDSFASALDARQGWKPREVEMRLTWACEARCEQCGMHSFVREMKETDYSRRLPLAKVLGVISELGEMGCEAMLFSGGEVTLVKDLPTIIRHCSEQGIAPHINTHGGNLKRDYCDELIACGLRGVMVSLDSGDPAQHDEIRKLPGLFERATTGLAYIRSQVPSETDFYMLINFVIMSKNFRTIPRLVDAVADAGVGQLSLSPISIENPWDDWANQGQSLSLMLSKAEEQELGTSVLPEAIKRASARRVTLMYPGDMMSDGTINFDRQFMHTEPVNCAVVHYHSVINVNGDVIPCCYSSPSQFKMGNIGQSSFGEIWNGPEYQNFRQGCFPAKYEMCASCSQHRNENTLIQRWYERRREVSIT